MSKQIRKEVDDILNPVVTQAMTGGSNDYEVQTRADEATIAILNLLERQDRESRIDALTELMHFGTDSGSFKIGSRGIRKHEIKARIAALKSAQEKK